MQKKYFCLLIISLLLFACQEDKRTVVNLWHTMEPVKEPLLKEIIQEFNDNNPHIKLVALQKNVEELRTGYQAAAALTGGGPELVYGPMDQIGPFEVMKLRHSDKSIIAPLEELFPPAFFDKFSDKGIIRYKGHIYQIADRVGNHLALCYNKKLFKAAGLDRAPATMDELIEFGQKMTLDTDNDGKIDQYGLVWNYTEPFWLVPFLGGYGGWVFDDDNQPTLDTTAAVEAFQLIKDMRDKYHIIPPECDYNIADNKFNQGTAAMLINGDWSWGKYDDSPKVDFGLARIPMVTQTGKWAAPMISATGYSINSNIWGVRLEATKKAFAFLTGESVQARFSRQFKSIPSIKTLLDSPDFYADPIVKASVLQIQAGRLMPIIPEMRAVWDAMRPALQNVLGNNMSPVEAAAYQQKLALEKIAAMNDTAVASPITKMIVYVLGAALIIYLLYFVIFKFIMVLAKNPHSVQTQNSRFAVLLAAPAAIIMFGVVVYPFLYNFIISLSNMNMTNVNSWSIVGLSQYTKVLSEKIFYVVFLKTLIWTVVNVTFHVIIGVFLAMMLNRKLPGRTIFRVLLILPWAVPQYITALTWRGMFMAESGAINLLLNSIGLTSINWLSDPTMAFVACIITNIWLGFPFMMVIALGALQSIPHELYEAAEIDGAGAWHKFKNVTIPMIKPVMIPAVTLGIVWTFNNLNVMWLVTNGGEPADHSHILVSYVYRAAFNLYRYGYAAAFSVLIFILLVAFSLKFMDNSKMAEVK